MQERAAEVIARLHAAVDSLLDLDLDALGDDELLDLVRDTETATRRLAPVTHAQTSALDRRGLAHARGCSSTAALLSQLLRIPVGEARARVRAADRLAPRHSFTGEVLPPLCPTVATAQAAGEISPQHARAITAAIDSLPPAVDVGDTVAEIATFLVDQARQFAPDQLGTITRHLLEVLDPDGTLTDSTTRDRRRDLTLHRRTDGSVTGTFEGTAEFGECLGTLLDVFAAPRPAGDGVRDPRTVGQRQHDGFVDAMRLAIRSTDLPTAHGVLATVILTMTAEQWAADQGLALTGHGALLPIRDAKNIIRGEARLFPVVLDDSAIDPASDPPPTPTSPVIRTLFRTARPIAGYGTSHRLFTEGARLAMTARDHGCTFPGCTAPAAWCEADHVTDWSDTGRTSVDDGHLACPFHHRQKDHDGWRTVMRHGLPHWIAPPWLDPAQTPQRNRAHDPLTVG